MLNKNEQFTLITPVSGCILCYLNVAFDAGLDRPLVLLVVHLLAQVTTHKFDQVLALSIRSEVALAGLVLVEVGREVDCHCQIRLVPVDFWFEEKLDVHLVKSFLYLVKLKPQILTGVFVLQRPLPTLVLVVHGIVKHFKVEIRRENLSLGDKQVLNHKLAQSLRHWQHNLFENKGNEAVHLFGIAGFF